MKTLVIGYGNTLREDDGFGVVVALSLAKNPKYECICAMQLTPELVETIVQYQTVIFIDANLSNSAGVFAVPLEYAENCYGHALLPNTLMTMARKLYGAKTKYLIFSVGALSLGYSEELSPPLKEAAKSLICYLNEC
ncbi:hydrogenase maturation protease [Campylobacterota bacterium]|nr:hydrogenase maturation protease [Campylobacterota bacterium]